MKSRSIIHAVGTHPFKLTVDAADFGCSFAVLSRQSLLPLLFEGPGHGVGNETAAFSRLDRLR